MLLEPTASPMPIDGGLGTLLESRGHDLSDVLWSARMLLEHPDEVRAAHDAFFAAGARVAISGSYQVSADGFSRARLDPSHAADALRSSVRLARESAQAAEAATGHRHWVAASVGPYGAMLADGSEYRGDYGVSVAELRDWHAPRIEVLASERPDVLAIETIPSLDEIAALLDVLRGTGLRSWLSVTPSLGALRTGESLADAFAAADDVDEIVAVGVNCCHPSEVAGAVATARRVTQKPVVVYPNSGESWDAKNRTWVGRAGFPSPLVEQWLELGASLVGGCCRVGPAQISQIAGVVGRVAR